MLKLTGAFAKNPKREKDREGEPEILEPLGPPPGNLNEAQSARWQEIAGWCAWLTVVDRPMVEIVAKLWQAVRDGEASPPELKTLVTCLSHLGMTPVDRSKVKVLAKPKAKNQFGALTG